MKNQVYLERIIKILREFKRDYPDWDISQIISLSTDCKNLFLTDKELHGSLKTCKDSLDADMTNLSQKDLVEVIKETEDLFKEVDYDPYLDGDIEERNDWENRLEI